MTLVEQLYDELTTAVNNRDEAELLFNENPGEGEKASLDYWEDEIYWLNQRLDAAQQQLHVAELFEAWTRAVTS